MLQVDMSAQIRQAFGKGAARTMRRAGQTPAVLYGPKTEPMPLMLESKEFTKGLFKIHQHNAVINLSIDEGSKQDSRHVMIKEIQTDPTQDWVIHADFYEISLDEPMTLQVPLTYKGKAKGVELGGDLIVHEHTVALQAKALDIPDSIEIDVSALELGESISCKDLAIPAGVTLMSPEDRVCVSVSGAVAEAAASEEAAEEAAEG